MILFRLTTENYRNLAAGEHEFHPQANILVGRNGQGKTNLLEAIYFLATTRSFRTSRVASVVRFDAPSVFAAGSVERAGVTRQISVGIEAGESRRRVLQINAERVTLHAYVAALTVFAYSAARLEIVRGAPEEKRRFLDRGIAGIDAGYLDALARYMQVLRNRNALLQAIAGGRSKVSDLDSWDEQIVGAAATVQKARAAYAAALAARFSIVVAEHNYHVGNLEISYRPNTVEDLPRLRRREIAAGMSLVGPQRDTIEFLAGGRPAAEVLSGGEQKMIVLFLKFSKIAVFRERREESPLFLLDDIDAELDLEILQSLVRNLPPQTQLFATSAKEAFLDILEHGPHRRLMLENGKVTSARDFR